MKHSLVAASVALVALAAGCAAPTTTAPGANSVAARFADHSLSFDAFLRSEGYAANKPAGIGFHIQDDASPFLTTAYNVSPPVFVGLDGAPNRLQFHATYSGTATGKTISGALTGEDHPVIVLDANGNIAYVEVHLQDLITDSHGFTAVAKRDGVAYPDATGAACTTDARFIAGGMPGYPTVQTSPRYKHLEGRDHPGYGRYAPGFTSYQGVWLASDE